MTEQIKKPETVNSPEQIIGAMSIAMQVAFSECAIEPVPLADGGSERSVETGFRNSIQPIAVKLVEKTDADGSKSYEYNAITYHDTNTATGVRWTEGGSVLERIWQPVNSKSEFSATAVRQIDPVGFELHAFGATVEAVPKEYKAEQAYNKYHEITPSDSRFEQKVVPRKGIFGKALGKFATARARRS